MIDDNIDVGLDFGWLLDWFWLDFAKVWAAKMNPKPTKNKKTIPETKQTKTLNKTRLSGGEGERAGGGPLLHLYITFPMDKTNPMDTPQRAQGPGADIYIYIYL